MPPSILSLIKPGMVARPHLDGHAIKTGRNESSLISTAVAMTANLPASETANAPKTEQASPDPASRITTGMRERLRKSQPRSLPTPQLPTSDRFVFANAFWKPVSPPPSRHRTTTSMSTTVKSTQPTISAVKRFTAMHVAASSSAMSSLRRDLERVAHACNQCPS